MLKECLRWAQKNIVKKILIAILVICASVVLCGAGWFNDTKVVIDTENNQVYQYYTADKILSEFTNDSKEGKTVHLKEGDGFAQGIFLQYGITVDDDADGVRNGGFGSTN